MRALETGCFASLLLVAFVACTAPSIDGDGVEPSSEDDDKKIGERDSTGGSDDAGASVKTVSAPPTGFTPTVDGGLTGAATAALGTELRIRAFVDGKSELVLFGTTAHWHQLRHAVPGRWHHHDEPTFLNDAPWMPSWPDDDDNRDCGCDSGPSPPLPAAAAIPQTVTVKNLGKRGAVTISEQPSAANDFALKVAFDDPEGGAGWHEVIVSYRSR